MDTKVKCFDGTGDVFLEKVSLHSSLKGYDGEKAAQNLASKLEGRAFDVYMRLSTADRKKVDKIQSELLKEFERGNLDRETAIVELSSRRRKSDESPQTFAYKIIEFVKLCPSFDDNTRKTIAKDYYLIGLHPKMQIELKSLPSFNDADVDKLTSETMRLQLAGIDSFASENNQKCMMSVEGPSMVDEIAEKVIEKMKGISIGSHGVKTGVNKKLHQQILSEINGEGTKEEEEEVIFQTSRIGLVLETQEIFAHRKEGENVAPAKALSIFYASVPSVFAKLAGTKVMMLGILPVPNIND